MSLLQDIEKDLGVFYDTESFGKECIYNENTLVYLERDDVEVEDFKEKCITLRNNDGAGIEEGDVLNIISKDYEVFNTAPLGDLETILLVKVKDA